MALEFRLVVHPIPRECWTATGIPRPWKNILGPQGLLDSRMCSSGSLRWATRKEALCAFVNAPLPLERLIGVWGDFRRPPSTLYVNVLIC